MRMNTDTDKVIEDLNCRFVVPLPELYQCRMGHSDAQITMNIYNHIAEKSHVENEMSKMKLPETVPAVV